MRRGLERKSKRKARLRPGLGLVPGPGWSWDPRCFLKFLIRGGLVLIPGLELWVEIMASKEASSAEQKLWCYEYKIPSPELAQVFKSPSSPERRARKIPKILKIGAWDGIRE